MKKLSKIIAAADVVLAAAMGGVMLWYNSSVDNVSLQYSADSWAGDPKNKFSVVSYYTSEGSAMDYVGVISKGNEIKRQLTGQVGDDFGSAADCWYSQKQMRASGDIGSGAVRCFSVGGDFFSVHLPQVLSGSPFGSSPNDIYTVVLDEYASWKLFGSIDTAGLTVNVNDVDFTVSAVISAPEKTDGGELYKAYMQSDDPVIYLPFQAAALIDGSGEGVSEKFTCYEIIMPDSIDRFAYDLTAEIMGYTGETENTLMTDSRSRFSIKNLKEDKDRIANTVASKSDVILPYWEYAAQSLFIKLSVLYKICILPAALLMMSAVYWIVKLCGLISVGVKKLISAAAEKADHKKLINYYRAHQKHKLAEAVMTEREKRAYEKKNASSGEKHSKEAVCAGDNRKE